MAMTLLIAGHETTANMISLSTVALWSPRPARGARGDPRRPASPGGTPALLDERRLRDLPGGDGRHRDRWRALRRAKDHRLGRFRQPRSGVFPDPDTFDIHRPARGHLAFGYGMHQCLGQNLARLELEIVLTTLVTRVPDLRLAVPVDRAAVQGGRQPVRPLRLPVTW